MRCLEQRESNKQLNAPLSISRHADADVALWLIRFGASVQTCKLLHRPAVAGQARSEGAHRNHGIAGGAQANIAIIRVKLSICDCVTHE